ncbi:MAG: hypothetical protein A3G34_16360 [Candidatus Lindowbacteria bacterium RIFCSPLOWO2_12_FULL_62_27]|nr:MAG: hypothetical protein A3G34_16360 [Candidatus Lindowbacteria bacterium RIFCSPLOWO2_12_FULL_62_27]
MTAVDTNILLDVLLPDPQWRAASSAALYAALQQGQLVVCEVVLAELAAQIGEEATTQKFMSDTGISLASTPGHACLLAGLMWKQYRAGGRSSDIRVRTGTGPSMAGGGSRTRILPDFLVASHAQTCADQFLTRDLGFYRAYFKDLSIVSPAP